MGPGNRGLRSAGGVDADEAEQLLDHFLLWTAIVCATFGPFEIATGSALGVWQLRAVGLVVICLAVVALVGPMALVLAGHGRRSPAPAAASCSGGRWSAS